MMIIFGFLSGILGGMGVGGGAVLIPALTLLLGFPQRTAQMINLLYFIPTAAAAVLGHIKNKKIETDILIPIILWGILGCIIGSFAALKLDNRILRRLFGVFLAAMGIRELVLSKKTGINRSKN